MDAQDRQVPAPRRPAVPRLHRPTPTTALPFAVPGEVTPRVADLSALLGEIDALRLTLQTDLTLAAAALEAGAVELAGELVDSDLDEVRGFGSRAVSRLTALGQPQDVPEEPGEVAIVPSPLRRRRILSAAPLMAAAAALIGFVAFVPDRGVPASPETRMTSAVAAGYELNRLARAGAPDEALRLAAEELNDELAELIAQAANDPAAAQQALMLLDATSEVLASQGDSGVLRGVIAETQALRARLRDALPVVAQRAQRTTRPNGRKASPTLASVPLVKAEPEKSRESAPASSSPKPSASPSPAPQPTTTSPSPAPSEEPSAAPSSGGSDRDSSSEGPLPQPGDLPGW